MMAATHRAEWKKRPAFGAQLVQRRKAGERIGLCIVAVHDEQAGQRLALRSGTARILVHEDSLPHELDWSCCVALDCLICGECDEAIFYATVTMLFAAGAASLWGEFADGFARLDRYPRARHGFIAPEATVPARALAQAIATHRIWSLMRSEGVYGAPVFAAARDDAFAKVFGPAAPRIQAMFAARAA